MKFSRDGEYLSAVMITGPKHVLLQVRLSEGAQGLPVCEMLPPVSTRSRAGFDADAIAANVLDGIAVANGRLARSFIATHIRYVADDTGPDRTGPESMYAHICLKLIEHFHG